MKFEHIPCQDATSDAQSSTKGTSGDAFRKATAGTSQNYNRSNVSTNTADDWISSFTSSKNCAKFFPTYVLVFMKTMLPSHLK